MSTLFSVSVGVVAMISVMLLLGVHRNPDTVPIDALVRDSPIPPPNTGIVYSVPFEVPTEVASGLDFTSRPTIPPQDDTDTGVAVREPERTSTVQAAPTPTEPLVSTQHYNEYDDKSSIMTVLCRYFYDCQRAFRMVICESQGIANLNTGNGFFGAFQFTLETWFGVGGVGLPSDASFDEQAYRASILANQPDGWSHWPKCGYA